MYPTYEKTREFQTHRWVPAALGIAVVAAMAALGAVGIIAALGVSLLIEVLRNPIGGIC